MNSITRFCMWPKAQVAFFALVVLLQRLPIIKHVLQFEKALSAPLASILRTATFTATALGGMQAYTGASTFVSNRSLPTTGTVGESFLMSFGVVDTENPAQWWIVSGDLPPGLSVRNINGDRVDAEAGLIEGTPIQGGSFSFELQPFYMDNDGIVHTSVSGAFDIEIVIEGSAGPEIVSQPQDTVVGTGERAQFFVRGDAQVESIQWQKDGQDIEGATADTLVIDAVESGDAGDYQAVLTSSSGSSVSESASLTIDDASPDSTFFNVSTRGFVDTGDRAMITGFVVQGDKAKTVLVRAVGPTLGEAPFNLPDTLADPVLSVVDAFGVTLASNDNWQSGGQAAELAAAFDDAGAFSLPDGSLDSALILTVNEGSYTVVISGQGEAPSGIAIAEAYQID